MKKRKLLAVLSVVLCLGVAGGCGMSAVDIEEPPTYEYEQTETDETTEALETEQETEELSAETSVEETEEKQAEAAKAEAEDKEKSDEAAEAGDEGKDDSDETAEDGADSEESDEKSEEKADAKANDAETSEDEDIVKLDKPVTMYAQNPVNVRKGPSTINDKLGYLQVNEEISVIGESKTTGWKQVTYKGQTAYVHGSRLGTEKVDMEARKAAEEAAAQAAAQQASTQQAAAPAAPATPKAKSTSGGILFIGDSRTCQMRDATGGAGCGWVCQYGADFGWFNDTGVPTADPLIGAGTRVVICMGVNDPGSIYSYARLVNEKAAEWVARGARVYYVSLNPVDHPYEDKIIPIDSFNATMPSQLANVYWIDTYSVVKQGGYVLEDGIHYDAAGNINIFNMIIGCVK